MHDQITTVYYDPTQGCSVGLSSIETSNLSHANARLADCLLEHLHTIDRNKDESAVCLSSTLNQSTEKQIQ